MKIRFWLRIEITQLTSKTVITVERTLNGEEIFGNGRSVIPQTQIFGLDGTKRNELRDVIYGRIVPSLEAHSRTKVTWPAHLRPNQDIVLIVVRVLSLRFKDDRSQTIPKRNPKHRQ